MLLDDNLSSAVGCTMNNSRLHDYMHVWFVCVFVDVFYLFFVVVMREREKEKKKDMDFILLHIFK